MRRVLIGVVACAVLTACHGSPFKLKATTPDNKGYTAVGEVEGSAGGFLLFGIIPIMKNDMMARAFDEALLQKGADYLISPTVDERWYWTPIGNGFVTTVKGTAAKAVKP